MKISDGTPCFSPAINTKRCKGLALQCLDRMLRPPCLDVGAGAIIQDGKFLAARRAQSKHAGWWEFPGGKFEDGENASMCLIREIKEELELDVTTGEMIGKWIFDHGDVVVRLHVMGASFPAGRCNYTYTINAVVRWP